MPTAAVRGRATTSSETTKARRPKQLNYEPRRYFFGVGDVMVEVPVPPGGPDGAVGLEPGVGSGFAGGGSVAPGVVEFTGGVVIKLGIVPVPGVAIGDVGTVEPGVGVVTPGAVVPVADDVVTNVPFVVTVVGAVGLDASHAVAIPDSRSSGMRRIISSAEATGGPTVSRSG